MLGFPLNSQCCCTLGSSSVGEDDTVIHFEDFVEKDWSFLDYDEEEQQHIQKKKMDRIISAGEISETSRILLSAASEAFVDRVVSISEQMLVVHDSLFILACIKEKYDKVKCWQGEFVHVPEKWAPFDVVFLYSLPSLPFELNQILEAISKRCVPGGRVVISHPQGRQVSEEQKQQYPDVVISSLPEKMMLHASAANHSFQVVEFVDEPGLYLAVLRLVDNQPIEIDGLID